MKHLTALLLLCGYSCALHAQLPGFEWGNYSTGSGDIATSTYATCYDHSGNSFVLGAFNNQSGTLDIDPSPNVVALNGYVGMFVAKYGPAGQLLWGRQIQVTTMQIQSSVTPRGIACDDSGNVYITGAVMDVYIDFDMASPSNPIHTTSGGFDLFLAKYSSSGNFAWSMLLGSTSHEEGTSLCVLGDKLFMVGRYGCNTDFDPGPGTHIPPVTQLCVAGFLACYTVNGDFLWEDSFCGPSMSDAGYALLSSVRLDSHNDLIICGRLGGVVDFNPGPGLDTLSVLPTGGVDGVFAKFDTAGNFIFAKALVTIAEYIYPYMDVDRDDNIIIAGSFNGIVDFDPSAGVYTDTALNYNASMGNDAFIAKYDKDGNFLWEKSFGTPGAEDIVCVTTNSANHILVGGYFTDVMDVDCGPGVYTLTDVNNNSSSVVTDGFAVQYDENGNIIFGFVVSGFSYDAVSGIACYNDKFVITGNFSQTWDFDPTAGTATLPAAVAYGINYFHVQYFDAALAASVAAHTASEGSVTVFPVPATATVNFAFASLPVAPVAVVLYSADGKTVLAQQAQTASNMLTVDVSSLAAGMYVAEIVHDGLRETKLIVVAPE